MNAVTVMGKEKKKKKNRNVKYFKAARSQRSSKNLGGRGINYITRSTTNG